jgi:hypothetical protein
MAKNPSTFSTALLGAQNLFNVLVDHIFERVSRLTLCEALALCLLTLLPLFELRVFALVSLQALLHSSVSHLRQSQRPNFAQPDFS